MDDRPRRMRLALPLAAAGLLAVAVGCVAFFAARGGEAQTPATVAIESDSGLVGSTVVVRLSVNVPATEFPAGLGAFTINVEYDPAALDAVVPCTSNPTSLSRISITCNRSFDNNNVDPDVVRVVGFYQPEEGFETGPTGDVALADISFQILAAGVTDLTLDVDELTDATLGSPQPIGYVTSDGTITGLTVTATPTATNTPLPPTATATRTATATSTPITPTATRTATATSTPITPTATRTPTMTSTPCPNGAPCPTPTPTSTERHVRERTHTPVPSATSAPETPVPTTIPQVTVIVPTTAPSGGAGPNIIAPPTGSGDGSSGPTAWMYCMAAGALAALATGGFAVVVRRRRHSE